MVAVSAFNSSSILFEGWYWALPSHELKRGRTKAATLCGRDLVLWRGDAGVARAADAYCPHMGAHLALGCVDGNGLRCFFHGWRFGASGRCDVIPALNDEARPAVRLRMHEARERFGMIWIWIGDAEPPCDVPIHPLLADAEATRAIMVASWRRRCSPCVLMINAIDQHHFRTVHQAPGEVLDLATESVDRRQFRVFNRGAPPNRSALQRLAAFLYRDKLLYYEINYFHGAVGCVSFGPSWARLHLMFATRPSAGGGVEGVTIALTPARKGLLGWLLDWLSLSAAALGGAYFAHGDAKVFDAIRFDLKTPIPADRTVMDFMRHIEGQVQARNWRAPEPQFQIAAE